MRLISISCESASVEDCINEFRSKTEQFLKYGWYIDSASLVLNFGAFMHLSATLLVDTRQTGGKLLAEYSTGRNKEAAVQTLLSKINPAIEYGNVVAFRIGTYTTPVTRRTYAVGVVAYNLSPTKGSEITQTGDRRRLLAHVLSLFNYNPKVLNISELARVFGVSRDTIYYDIQQILKENVGRGKTGEER